MSNSIGSWAELEQYLSDYALTDEKIIEDMTLQASIFEMMIQSAFLAFYDDYTPKVYERQYALYNSIRVDPVVIDGSIAEMKIGFDETLANHPSRWGGDEGYVPWLISEGYHINWSKPYRIPMLSDREGNHWINTVVDEFNANNSMGLIVHAYFDDELIY